MHLCKPIHSVHARGARADPLPETIESSWQENRSCRTVPGSLFPLDLRKGGTNTSSLIRGKGTLSRNELQRCQVRELDEQKELKASAREAYLRRRIIHGLG